MRRAFYRSRVDPEIWFGLYDDDGSTSGEMCMRWHTLGGQECPQLEVLNDAWEVLTSFNDLIDTLGEYDSQNITPETFISILKDHSFADKTV